MIRKELRGKIKQLLSQRGQRTGFWETWVPHRSTEDGLQAQVAGRQGGEEVRLLLLMCLDGTCAKAPARLGRLQVRMVAPM